MHDFTACSSEQQCSVAAGGSDLLASGSPRHDILADPVEYPARDAERLMETVVKVRRVSSGAHPVVWLLCRMNCIIISTVLSQCCRESIAKEGIRLFASAQ